LNETKKRSNLESQRLESLKVNLIQEHGGVFIKESRGDLPVINNLANGTVLNKEQLEKI